MKKLIAWLILPLMLVIASCEKREYVVPNRTVIVNLAPGNWISSDEGRTFTAGIDMPEIDSYFNEYGAVLVYASFGSNVYEQIPEVYDGVAYSFTHRYGQVVIEIQSADGTSPITAPGGLKVKIVLVESE
jgi:hypothetical protein